MGGVGGKVTQVKCLVHNALPCKCSISMQEDGHHLGKGKEAMMVISDSEQGTTRKGPSSPPHELSASQKGHGAAHEHIQCFPRGWEWSQPWLTY